MHERWRILLILSLSLLAVPVASATTVAPPANLGQLARISEAVVFAQAIESRVEEGSSLPYTITRFLTLQRVAGADTGLVFEVRVPGGAGKRRGAAVGGAPRFQADSNYLLFLDPAPEQRWQSKMLAYGLLVEVPGSDVLEPLPESGDIDVFTRKSFEPPGRFRRDALLRHLRDVVRGAPWDRRQVVAGEALESKSAPEQAKAAPSSCRFLTDPPPPNGDGFPIRWFGFEQGTKTVTISPTTPGQVGISDGGVSAVQEGAASWTNHSDSVIHLLAGAARPENISCTEGFDRDAGGVIFNDPCGDIDDFVSCDQPANFFSFGGVFYEPSIILTHDGAQWHPATSTWVIINNGTECVGEINFKEVVAHELGHTQGFGHHVPANPADALMSAPYKGDGLGAALRPVDKSCASFAYHTFLDIPHDYFAWRFIEAVENAGVMGEGGCGAANFCPNVFVTRGSMARFLLLAKEGANYVPPPCTTPTFSDVPCHDPLAPWVEELVRRNVTAGCGGGQYCPNNPVTRNQMAVFLIKTFEGPAFVPPACTTPPFNDVPCSSPFAPWVKLITDRGITAGCGGGNYCPALEVNRAQMSVFLTQNFGLPAPPAPLP